MADQGPIGPALSSIRWADQVVLLALCVAESALLWLCATAVLAVPAGVPDAISPWLVFGLVWGTAILPRALEALDVWEPWHQVVMVIGIAASLVVSIHVICFAGDPWLNADRPRLAAKSAILRQSEADISVWCAILLVAAVWWRAYVRDEPTRDAAFRLLRAGSLGMLAGAIILAVTDRATGQVESSGAVLIFFIAALAAIGLASLTSGDNAGRAEPSTHTVLVSFAPVLIAVVLAVLLSGIVRRDVLDTVVWALGPLLWGISVVVRVIVLAIALVAVIILSPFLWLMEGRSFRLRPIRFDGSGIGSNGMFERATNGANATPDPIRYLLAAAVIFVLFAGVTRFVLRRRKRRGRSVRSEERERIRPLFDVSKALASLRKLLGLRQQERVDDPLDELRKDQRWSATVRIREQYREMLRWSADRDLARQPGQTAAEHAAGLMGSLSGTGAREDIAVLTRIYARARYAADPAKSADAEKVEAAWNRIARASRDGK